MSALSAVLGYSLKAPNPIQLDVRFEDWLDSPSAQSVRHLWLEVPQGYSSIVQVAGIQDAQIRNLYDLAEHLAGVTFVDMVGDADTFLAQYRYIFIGIFVLAVCLLFYCQLVSLRHKILAHRCSVSSWRRIRHFSFFLVWHAFHNVQQPCPW